MKNIKILIIILMLFIGIKNVGAIKDFDNTIKVYDYAQLLTDKEENKFKKEVNNYINKYNIDMVIVTVKYYDQQTIDEYINLFYNINNFGKGNNKKGIILVIDLKSNNTSIKTFGNIDNLYSEDEISSMIEMINSEDKYYKKITNFIKYSDKYINEFSINNVKDTANNIFSIINWYIILIPSIIVPGVVIIIGILQNNNVKKQHTANYYIVKDSIVINAKKDKFVSTNTKKNRINNK